MGVQCCTVVAFLAKNLVSFPLGAPHYIVEKPVAAPDCSQKEAVMAEILAEKKMRAVPIG